MFKLYEMLWKDWNFTGVKIHLCPSCLAGTGANFPLSLCGVGAYMHAVWCIEGVKWANLQTTWHATIVSQRPMSTNFKRSYNDVNILNVTYAIFSDTTTETSSLTVCFIIVPLFIVIISTGVYCDPLCLFVGSFVGVFVCSFVH